MASIQNVVGDIQTAAEAGGLSNQVPAGLINGRVKVTADSYTADTTEAAGSTITFCGPLPQGARILNVALSTDTAQAGLTFKAGTTANDDEFIAAGATSLQTASVVADYSGKGYTVGTAAGDDEILITTAGATLTAGNIYCIVTYVTD